MALPSAKRRRLILSDDDEPVVKIRTPQPRLSSRPKTTLANGKSASHSQNPKKSKAKSATQASPKSSPEKPGKQIVKDKENKSLHTFFGRATEEQRWARRHESPTTIIEDGEAGDAIEDDSLDEALVELANCETDENEVLDRRKTSQPVPRTSFPAGLKNGPGSSQKFAKPPKQATKGLIPLAGQDTDNSNRPWADRFAPNSLDELAVHKKKLGDVQNWLSAVLFGRDRRVCAPRV